MSTVRLLHTNSAPNTIKKSFSILANVEVKLKEPIDVDNPVLILSGAIDNINYFYLTDFGQYYFADPLRPTGQNNIFELSGHVDPLMSNQAEILNLKGILARVTNPSDDYLADPELPLSVKSSYETVSFPEHFNKDLHFILITSG